MKKKTSNTKPPRVSIQFNNREKDLLSSLANKTDLPMATICKLIVLDFLDNPRTITIRTGDVINNE